MSYERYHYNNWHCIRVSDYVDMEDLIGWCHQQAKGAFQFRTDDVIPYRKIEHKHGYSYWFCFELGEDALLFALTWGGEESA